MNDLERVGRHIVRTFYDPLPTNDDDAPIWCLGQRYDSRQPLTPNTSSSTSRTEPETVPEDDSWIQPTKEEVDKQSTPILNKDPSSAETYGGWPKAFLDDFESRVWMTYRSGFSPIPRSQDPKAAAAMSFRVRMQNLTQAAFASDSGFGCMIRSGQCILANTLSCLNLGRDWRVGQKDERPLLSLFADDPRAPFSIHRFVQRGAAVCGKYPGEWFGPSATARCIQDLVNEHEEVGLKVYITGDGSDVYEDNLMKVAKADDGTFHPTLVLVGTRLGIDKITPVYWEALKSSLQMSQSIGIAGGRPSASHYFVGTQGNHFFYLDPHETRRLLPFHEDVTMYTTEDIKTCHTRRLRRIEIKEMDPSMLIAFLIRDESDWKDWKQAIVSVQGKALMHVAKSEPQPLGNEREEAIDEVESFDEQEEDM
ncbi:putative cysteine protease ATG4 [Delitschia confertaspora ATCC 74209]|uniref:Cysteine protease n=1 Tax=Delitschia confertaspora ATCC 74209 TaxID=1513339 RepID=A0A9P4JMP6_9PLEO|nr:putative cysteine protease ATG4 [Delitschia confertaspora ATCC 74209]